MTHMNIVTLLAIGAVATACAKQESASTDTGKATAAAGAATTPAVPAKVGETLDMKTPESARYDPELDVFYVSNVNGNPSQHDGNGSIIVVQADSTGVSKVLVESGKNGATLDGPKGLALVGDTLWVADIDHLRAFNRRTGAPVADINLAPMKATFLNDVVVGGDGGIYVTDTGLNFDAKGAMTHPGADQIFKIVGRKAAPLQADSLNGPNGIAWDKANGRFVLAPSTGNAVQTWMPGDKKPTTLATGPGQYDGVEVLADGRILVTSWADSAVHLVQHGSMSTFIASVAAPADIGIDTKRGVVAVPRFNDGKVEYYKIP